MKILSEKDLPFNKDFVCSIGNFDGFHKGHIKVLKTLKDKSKEYGLNSLVISFYPHPREFFSNTPICKILNLDTKIEFLDQIGIDYFFNIKFDKSFASLTKEQFLIFLKKKIRCKAVIVGEEWRFGKNREGDVNFLAKNNINVFPVKLEEFDSKKLGSSLVRNLLKEGKIKQLNDVLGRTYCLKGKVVEGKKIGRNLGFPTINVDFKENLCLKYGVYGGFLQIGNKFYLSAINYGVKPTVDNISKPILEAHVIEQFNYFNDEFVKVYFVKYIREEKKFKNLEELKNQIKIDINEIKGIGEQNEKVKPFNIFNI